MMWVRAVGSFFFLSLRWCPSWDKNKSGEWLYPSLLTSILKSRLTSNDDDDDDDNNNNNNNNNDFNTEIIHKVALRLYTISYLN